MKILGTEELILGAFMEPFVSTAQLKSQLGDEVGLKQFLLICKNCLAVS